MILNDYIRIYYQFNSIQLDLIMDSKSIINGLLLVTKFYGYSCVAAFVIISMKKFGFDFGRIFRPLKLLAKSLVLTIVWPITLITSFDNGGDLHLAYKAD